MDLVCPDCRADLVIVDGQNATCAGHDGRYQILFDRSAAVAPPAAAPPAATENPNIKECGQCQSPNPLTAEFCGSCGAQFTLLNLTTRPARPLNANCAQHPDVAAVTRCRVCRKGVCATCDFLLPGNVHVCPACLEKEPPSEISPKRRALQVIAMLIAAFSTLMMVLATTGSLHRTFGHDEGANAIIGNLMLWPAIAGLVVALTTLDRRLKNSVGIWIAVAWNALNLGIFMIFMVIGLTRS